MRWRRHYRQKRGEGRRDGEVRRSLRDCGPGPGRARSGLLSALYSMTTPIFCSCGDRLAARFMQADCEAGSAAIGIATAVAILVDTFARLRGLADDRAGSAADGCPDCSSFPGAAGQSADNCARRRSNSSAAPGMFRATRQSECDESNGNQSFHYGFLAGCFVWNHDDRGRAIIG